GRHADRAGGLAVHGIDFVVGPHHQAGERRLHPERGIAPEDEAVERIEGGEVLIVPADRADLREHPALWGINIDEIEVLEVGGILEVAETRNAVRMPPLLRLPRFLSLRRGVGGQANTVKGRGERGNKTSMDERATAQAHGGLQNRGDASKMLLRDYVRLRKRSPPLDPPPRRQRFTFAWTEDESARHASTQPGSMPDYGGAVRKAWRLLRERAVRRLR